MSRSATRYEDGWLCVRVSDAHLRRAEIRLTRQGVSGLAALGSVVRALVLGAGGYRRRGRGLTRVAERGLAASRRRSQR